MHFNGKRERDRIIAQEEAAGFYRFAPPALKYHAYVNLCLYPFTWEDTYISLKSNKRISLNTWNCLLGALMAMLLSMKRKTEHTIPILSEIAIDFIEYIRLDRGSDPWRFLFSMKRYFPRYVLMRSLLTVGIDWREVAYDLMGAKHKPAYGSYHSLFTNIYIRTLIKATTVYKQMRSTCDEDYEPGVNDKHSLLLRESKSKKCLSYKTLESVVDLYLTSLPSWNPSIRAKVCYYISFLRPLHELMEKQMLPATEAKILGSKSKS